MLNPSTTPSPTARKAASDVMSAIDRALALNDEENRNRALGLTALTVGQVSHVAGANGVSFRLSIPETSEPVTYAHEVSGNVYQTRDLVVWLVDTRESDGFHTVTLLGDFTELGALVELEGWDSNVALAEALEDSEYLEAQGLRLTVGGYLASTRAY